MVLLRSLFVRSGTACETSSCVESLLIINHLEFIITALSVELAILILLERLALISAILLFGISSALITTTVMLGSSESWWLRKGVLFEVHGFQRGAGDQVDQRRLLHLFLESFRDSHDIDVLSKELFLGEADSLVGCG